jgi:hypothetical protein
MAKAKMCAVNFFESTFVFNARRGSVAEKIEFWNKLTFKHRRDDLLSGTERQLIAGAAS